jgi:hypothetical protein
VINFRPANEAELPSLFEVLYQNELLDNPDLPLPIDIPPYLSHVLQTGTLYVAEILPFLLTCLSCHLPGLAS